MKKLFFSSFLCLLSLLGYGQNEPIFTDTPVIPPSPNATAFNKFIDIPVGHYTGIPNISVPIYTLNLPQLNLPISLNYHAGGLKVGERSSWIGAGWSLSAGGTINRTVRGLPDEYTGPGRDYRDHSDGSTVTSQNRYGFLRLDTSYFDASKKWVDVFNIPDCPVIPGAIPDIPRGPINDVDHFAEGLWDTEPDLWHYSFPGGSGKFVFNRQREMVKYVVDNDSIITNAYTGLVENQHTEWRLDSTRFVIRDAQGITYTFSETEKLRTASVCGGPGGVNDDLNMESVSSWHLTRMSRGGNWIEFDYETEVIDYAADFSESRRFALSGPGVQISSFCRNTTRLTGKRLTTIRTSNGYEVIFEPASNDRDDLENSFGLSRIIVNKGSDQIMAYQLYQGYFGSDVKLKLDSVQQLSNVAGNAPLPPYKFSYIGDSPLGSFPSLDSKQQDYWGFYNGAMNNSHSMVPQWKTEDYHVNVNSKVDRSPNLTATQKGVLNRITYPTGGYSEFYYELNDYYAPSYQRTYQWDLETPDVQNTTDTLNFSTTQDASITFIRNNELIDDGSDPNPDFSDGIDQWVTLRECTGPNYTSCTRAVLIKTVGNRFVLPAGDYQLYAKTRQGADTANSHTLKVVYEQTETIPLKEAGGLRVRKVKSYDPVTNQSIQKAYQYRDSSVNAHSSGLLFTRAYVGGSISSYRGGSVQGNLGLDYCQDAKVSNTVVTLSTSPSVSTATYQGSHIGYSSVQEFSVSGPLSFSDVDNGSGMKNGMTEYHFVNEEPLAYYTDPYVPAEDLTHKNGKLKKQIVYKYTAPPSGKFQFTPLSNLVKLSETDYHYSYMSFNDVYAKGLNFKKVHDSFCYSCQNATELDGAYAYRYYTINPNWYFLTGQTTRVYDEDGSNPKETIQKFFYDHSQGHYFQTSSFIIDSEQDTIRTVLGRDVMSPGLIRQKETFKLGSADLKLSGERLSYYGGLPTGYSTWNRELAGTVLEGGFISSGYEQVKKLTYDNASMLVEAVDRPTFPSEAKTAYLWSYDSAYLVAQITNISEVELDNILENQLGFSRMSFRNAIDNYTIQTKLKDLRALITGKDRHITTYLYESPYGVTEITDPNGLKTTYQYDDFGRLVTVKDDDEYVLVENEYNYSNQ